MAGVFRRCGCRDENGKQYAVLLEQATDEQRGRACPKMLNDPKHGKWSYILSAKFDPITGKRQRIRGGAYVTKREAQQARAKDIVKLGNGQQIKADRITLGAYLPKWLERHARTGKGLAPQTVINYRRYIEQDIVPSALGRMWIGDVRRGHINDFLQDLTDKGRGAVTVHRIAAVIQGAFRAAAHDDRIPANPATDLRLPTVDAKPVNVWEPAQIGMFLDVAAQHRLGALFEVAVFTGMRRGELLALKWDDINFKRRVVAVLKQRTMEGTKTVERDETKSRAGRRVIELSDPAIGALMAWKIKQDAEREEWGAAGFGDGHVFTYENGDPLKPQYATRLFDKLRMKAGLPKLTFHGQRHSFVSLALASKTDIALVSKMVGHSAVSVTADIYAHLIGSAGRNAANAAASLVPRSAQHNATDSASLDPPDESASASAAGY